MIVITLSKVPQSLRGDLTKWCQEIQTGVYVGNFNAKIRDLLWRRINKNIGSGVATMVYNTNNELGYTFRTTRTDYEIVNFDGIPLLKHMELDNSHIKHGFSKAAKMHKARVFSHLQQKGSNDVLNSNVVALDIETTGLDPDKNQIISIGAVKEVERTTVTFYKLIKIDAKVPESISELTNLNNKILNKDGISLRDALIKLRTFVSNSVIVGYNLQFDMQFLRNELEKLDLPQFMNKTIDLMTTVKKTNLFLDNYRLETILKDYEIINENSHNSLSDAKATYKLFLKLNKKGHFKSLRP